MVVRNLEINNANENKQPEDHLNISALLGYIEEQTQKPLGNGGLGPDVSISYNNCRTQKERSALE